MIFYTILSLLLCANGISSRFIFRHALRGELTKLKCDMHDLIDTYKHEVEKAPVQNQSVEEITAAWRSTFPDGNYLTGTKNSIPFQQMSLRDQSTILRMAEYQTLVYCKSNIANSPSDISSITEMSGKNLRLGNFTIEGTGFDDKHSLFWYIAVNVPQQSIILVHRGTKMSDRDDVFDDLDRFNLHNQHGILNVDFPYLTQSKHVNVDIGFYTRFQDQKQAILASLREILPRYSSPSFSLIIVGHSLGAAWAFLNAGYLVSLNDINERLAGIYTFGQPLLGSASFVNEITSKLDTPKARYVRVVNGNDIVPHIGCEKCVQPEYANEKWVTYKHPLIWVDCHGGDDPQCSAGVPCNQLSWANHSAVGRFSMHSDFCRIASNQ